MGALALKAGRQEEAEIWFKKATDIGLQLDSPGSPASGFQPGPEHREADLASTVKVTLREDSTIDYVFATDLLVDGRRGTPSRPGRRCEFSARRRSSDAVALFAKLC